jgi:group I intron endonuclease
MIIYCITNTINSKQYIGKTQFSVEKRFKKHVYSANAGSNTYFHKAIRKYGIKAFKLDIIEESDNEKYWISQLNPEYNMTKGGDGGDTASSPNFKESMKNYHSKKSKESYATYGMLGKPGHRKPILVNRIPIICEGTEHSSITEAEKQYPGIKLQYRLDNPKFPEFYRLNKIKV